MPWYLYMIRCNDDSLYIGITKELCRRMDEHNAQGKRCAKYLRGRAPLTLVFTVLLPNHGQALSTEARLKRQTKCVKEAVAKGSLSLQEAIGMKG